MGLDMYGYTSLNPRFDGAFLIHKSQGNVDTVISLNPRFDGAFLIHIGASNYVTMKKS